MFEGLCALVELFLLHTFATFSGVRVALLIADRPVARVGQPCQMKREDFCLHTYILSFSSSRCSLGLGALCGQRR